MTALIATLITLLAHASPLDNALGIEPEPFTPDSDSILSAALESAELARVSDAQLIAGRFILRGKGTEQNPYEIQWRQLTSAQETYKPRDEDKHLPEHVTMLDGKWVTLEGWIAFPIVAERQDELLLMLNEWDGCCIGVPPTPYDAVEVRVQKPVIGAQRLTRFGSITGKLKVDPFTVRRWLISLYVMENATLDTSAIQ